MISRWLSLAAISSLILSCGGGAGGSNGGAGTSGRGGGAAGTGAAGTGAAGSTGPGGGGRGGGAGAGAGGAAGTSAGGRGGGAAGTGAAGTSGGGRGGGAAGTGAAGTSGPAGVGGLAGAGAGGRGGSSGTGAAGSAGTAGNGIPPGFGTNTPAGRGGAVIKVTTLAAAGAGSLDAAIRTAGPRIIVFEVGGVIDLNLARLTISEPFVTIAGQTAPAPGITLIRGGMIITTHDVLIQHVRFRIGDAGQAAGSGFEPDVSTDGPQAHDIVVDHCSVAWGVDENLSISGPRFDGAAGTSHAVTLSNNIIAEGLYDSIHEKGIHSMGTLVHDYCTDIAIIGNLYAHNNERNPWFKAFGTGVVVNNVIYNPGTWAVRVGAVVSEWSSSTITPQGPTISVVGNVMKHGADTPTGLTMVGSNSSGSAYVSDNLATDVMGRAVPITSSTVTVPANRPSWPNGLNARPAAETLAWVLAHAGARPKERDAVDARIVAGVSAGTGRFVNSQSDVGGYPTAALTRRALTVPATGIDAWLAGFTAAVE